MENPIHKYASFQQSFIRNLVLEVSSKKKALKKQYTILHKQKTLTNDLKNKSKQLFDFLTSEWTWFVSWKSSSNQVEKKLSVYNIQRRPIIIFLQQTSIEAILPDEIIKWNNAAKHKFAEFNQIERYRSDFNNND